METDVYEADSVEGRNKFEKCSLQGGLHVTKMEDALHLTDNPIEVDDRLEEKFCQICLQSEQLTICENMISLFSPLNANIRINEALAVCVGLEIFQEQDSSIGNQICPDCMKQLQATYNFRKLCWASQYELKSNQTHFHLEDRNDVEAVKSRRVSVRCF